ncbi:MAG: glycosyltransferase [Verrucomicrobiaceae bacterium]|nr:MAG: glycosyltransferase [Verrucomicrobiaceae bacterium]
MEVTDEDIRSLYRIADALFFPSRQEGFGLPMLEAAFHRVPAFCADIEPLRSFPGAIPFPLDATPTEIASTIIRQMQAWPANSPRKAVVRNYAWSAVYRKYLAPLLKSHKVLRLP